MRALVVVTLALQLAACADGDSLVVVTVDSSSILTGIATLRTTSTAGGRTASHDFTEAGGEALAIPPAKTFGIEVPRAITGTFSLTVEACDAAGVVMAAGQGSATLAPGARRDIAINLGAPGSDMAVADLAIPDLSGVAVDLTATPDLAALPDLVTPLMLAFNPPSWDFDALGENMVSTPPKAIVFQNQGAMTGQVQAMISGADAGQFQVESLSCAGFTLDNGDSCTATITFRPLGAGPRSAQLTIYDGVSSASMPLVGLAIGNLATMCGAGTHCGSGNCVDGVCCDVDAASCNGCNACNVNGAGTCAPVPEGQDPHDVCDAAPLCATGSCGGNGLCGAKPAGTVCQTDPCVNTSVGYGYYASGAFPIHQCSGTSFDCPASPTGTTSCAPYLCASATMCRTECVTDGHCTPDSSCNGGTCVAKVVFGGDCTRDAMCRGNGDPGGEGDASCIGGKCVGTSTCVTNNDCVWGVCVGGTCSSCPANSCAGSGWGSGCDSGDCSCAVNGDCTNQRTDRCQGNTGEPLCTCGNGISRRVCQRWQRCVTSGDSGGCLTTAGHPCPSNASCASGVCANGLCT